MSLIYYVIYMNMNIWRVLFNYNLFFNVKFMVFFFLNLFFKIIISFFFVQNLKRSEKKIDEEEEFKKDNIYMDKQGDGRLYCKDLI